MYSSNKIIFIAELIGTFGLVVGATGSIVYIMKCLEEFMELVLLP